MFYFLLISIAIIIVIIMYLFYITKKNKQVISSMVLNLDNEECKQLEDFYEQKIKKTYNYNLDENLMAVRLLNRLFNMNVDINNVIVGYNLNRQYMELTGENIKKEDLFYIRNLIGKEGEIAIIKNPEIHQILKNKNSFNPLVINEIIDNELDLIAKKYIDELLKKRWNLIREINSDKILNSDNNDGFLYLKDFYLPNTKTFKNELNYSRINLLCETYVFEEFLNRWRNVSKSMMKTN
jgi:hypothetical protein